MKKNNPQRGSISERSIIGLILSIVILMVGLDLISDLKEGVELEHLIIEVSVGIAALVGVFILVFNSLRLRRELLSSKGESEIHRLEAIKWREESKKFVEGLSQSIDEQMSSWSLSAAEKEVALLLLKGLSLKEVADIRGTSEKTARVQSMSVYSKSGLSGRSELAAFFLEDLLQPLAIDK